MRWRAWAVAAVVATTTAGCSLFRPHPAPPPVVSGVQVGEASWYGPGFHGRPTASGEIYDQYALTAAHPSLPLGSHTRVTSLTNQRSVEVRINDRGPFVGGRIVDLSYAAARRIDMIGPGVMPVRLEVLDAPERADRPPARRAPRPAPAHVTATRAVPAAAPAGPPPATRAMSAPPVATAPAEYVVDLGTFADRTAAADAQRAVATRFPDARVTSPGDASRGYGVRLGPYGARRSADARAEVLGRLGYQATVSAAPTRP